jgi:hypothetical protein
VEDDKGSYDEAVSRLRDQIDDLGLDVPESKRELSQEELDRLKDAALREHFLNQIERLARKIGDEAGFSEDAKLLADFMVRYAKEPNEETRANMVDDLAREQGFI